MIDTLGKTTISVEEILNYVRQIRDLTKGKADKEFEGVSGKMAEKLDVAICRNIYEIIKNKEDSADITVLQKFSLGMILLIEIM